MPCQNSQEKKFRCDVFNEMIEKVNRLTQEKMTEARKQFNRAMMLIPDSRIGGKLPSVVMSSDGIERRKRRRKRRRTIYVRMKERRMHMLIDERKRLRTTRDVFGKVGNVFADFFNLPNNHDMEVLKTHVQEVAKSAGKGKDELVESEKELSNFRIKTANSMATEMVRIGDNSKNINNLREDFIEEQKQHVALADKEMDALEILNKYVDYSAKMTMEVILFEYSLNSLLKHMNNLVDSIRLLATGYIPPYLVEPTDVQMVLNHVKMIIDQKYRDVFELTNSDVAFYYMMRSIVYARNGTDLIVMMKIPIHSVGGTLNVYRVESYQVYRNHNSTDSTRITNLPDYFAVDSKNDMYTEFSATFFDTCRGQNLKTCASQMSLQRQTSTAKTCAAALYFDSARDIMTQCDISYTYSGKIRPSRAKQLSNGTHLILDGDPNSTDTWKMNCPDAESGYNVRNVPSCTLCMIDVPCFCSLTSETFFIPLRLTNCVPPVDKQYPSITYRHLVNLPSVHTTFPEELADKFASDVAMINAKWPVHYPKPFIIRSDLSKVITAEKDEDADFKKTMSLEKRKTSMYGTAADKLLKHAQDWSDLAFSHLDDMQDQFTNFTSVLDAKGALGVFSVGVIFGIVSICLSCYILIKK